MRAVTFFLLLVLLAVCPIPFGAVASWAWGMIASAVGLLLSLHGAVCLLGRARPGPGLARTWKFLVPYGLTLVWIGVQASPIAPVEWHHPFWRQAEAVLGVDLVSAITIDASETMSGLIRLLAYGGVFWLAMELCWFRERAKQAVFAVTYVVLAYCIYGLTVEFSGAKSILWFEVNRVSVIATFLNYNSFATYAGLGLICATGLLLREFGDLGGSLGWRRWFHSLLHSMSVQGLVLILAWIVLATALLMSFSRGGFLSTSLGLAAMLLAYSRTQAAPARSGFVMAMPLLAIGFALYLYSGEVTDLRLARWALDSEGRTSIYELVVQAIEDRPLLGTGYGTFPDVFRVYRDDGLGREVQKAHNSYLEVGLELGIPAAGLLILSLVLVFARTVVGVAVRRRDVVFPCIGVGATVLVGAHSMVDFSLQIPAVAVTYAFIMGCATAQAWPSQG